MTVGEIIKDNAIWRPGSGYNSGENIEVTLLMPTFCRNKNGYLGRAIDSFLRQKMTGIELIIIDDASTDGSEQLIVEYMERDGRISSIRHIKNVGLPAVSIYEGYRKARGEYIGFLFDDCIIYPGVIKKTIDIMRESNVPASYGRVFSHSSKDDLREGVWLAFEFASIGNLEQYNFIANLSILCKRSVFEQIGWYDPHIMLIRLCDWDLLLRLKSSVPMMNTGLDFGEEFGVITKESLGNTHQLEHVPLVEYMHTKGREKHLSLDCYEDFDIFYVPEDASQLFILSMKQLKTSFQEKFWYYETKLNDDCHLGGRDFKKPTVTVVTGSVDASALLIFNYRLGERYSAVNYLMTDEVIATSDALIFARTLSEIDTLKKARMLDIPCYLLWDDNFKVLAKSIMELSFLTDDYVQEYLGMFAGIITSSKELWDEIRRWGYNDNVLLAEPVYHTWLESPIAVREPTEAINIAFTGGSWRVEHFEEHILPALRRLARSKEVHFYCPNYTKLMDILQKEAFKTTFIPFTNSLEQMLLHYGKNNIHVLIHPGLDHENNPYKTMNALMNAACLGAAFVASDVEPYQSFSHNGDIPFLLAENTLEGWFSVFRQAAFDEDMRRDLAFKARKACREAYNGETISDVLDTILAVAGQMTFRGYADRLINTGVYNGMQSLVTAPPSTIPVVINSIPENAVASPPIRKKASYSLQVPSGVLEGLVVFFGTHRKACSGTASVKILTKRGVLLREQIIDLGRIQDNAPHRILFTPLRIGEAEHLLLSLEFFYVDASAPVSLYEYRQVSQNKFLRKLRRLLGKNGKLCMTPTMAESSD